MKNRHRDPNHPYWRMKSNQVVRALRDRRIKAQRLKMGYTCADAAWCDCLVNQKEIPSMVFYSAKVNE